MSDNKHNAALEACVQKYEERGGYAGTAVGGIAGGIIGTVPVLSNVAGAVSGFVNSLSVASDGAKTSSSPAGSDDDTMRIIDSAMMIGMATIAGGLPVTSTISTTIGGSVAGKNIGELIGNKVGKLKCDDIVAHQAYEQKAGPVTPMTITANEIRGK